MDKILLKSMQNGQIESDKNSATEFWKNFEFYRKN